MRSTPADDWAAWESELDPGCRLAWLAFLIANHARATEPDAPGDDPDPRDPFYR